MLASLLTAMGRKRYVPAKGWKVLTGKEKASFNKGKRSMKTGYLDAYANFRQVPSMLPVYKVPDLTSFRLKPYVARRADKDEQLQ